MVKVSLFVCIFCSRCQVYVCVFRFIRCMTDTSRLCTSEWNHIHEDRSRLQKCSTPKYKKGIPSVESSRSVRGLRKGVSGKSYPRLCNARRPRLEPGTFQSQTVRLYRLHQARLRSTPKYDNTKKMPSFDELQSESSTDTQPALFPFFSLLISTEIAQLPSSGVKLRRH